MLNPIRVFTLGLLVSITASATNTTPLEEERGRIMASPPREGSGSIDEITSLLQQQDLSEDQTQFQSSASPTAVSSLSSLQQEITLEPSMSSSWGLSSLLSSLTNLVPGIRENRSLQTTIVDLHEKINLLENQLKEEQSARKRAELLKAKAQEERTGILVEIQRGAQVAQLQKLRQEELEKVVHEKNHIIRELEEANEKLQKENSDLKELEELLARELKNLSGTQESEGAQELRSLIQEAKVRVNDLEEETKRLQVEKEKAEQRAQQLNQAILTHDPYEQIKLKILDNKVSDGDLALFMHSIMTYLDQDLDKLSIGKEKSLVRLLIQVSRPEEDHSRFCHQCENGQKPTNYEGRFRKLGNLFLPRGLGYHGKPINWDMVSYNESTFKQNVQKYTKQAKKKLTQVQ